MSNEKSYPIFYARGEEINNAVLRDRGIVRQAKTMPEIPHEYVKERQRTRRISSPYSILIHRIRVSDDARYLTAGQIRERFGVSDMWIWRYMRGHNFPKPVKFGGPTSARHWLLRDIEQWERERTAISRPHR